MHQHLRFAKPWNLHTAEVASKPYPTEYIALQFSKFDSRRGNTREKVARFLDSIAAHANDQNLCLREFFKKLTDHALVYKSEAWIHAWLKAFGLIFQHQSLLRWSQVSTDQARQNLRVSWKGSRGIFKAFPWEGTRLLWSTRIGGCLLHGMLEEYRVYLENFFLLLLVADGSCKENQWVCQKDCNV